MLIVLGTVGSAVGVAGTVPVAFTQREGQILSSLCPCELPHKNA